MMVLLQEQVDRWAQLGHPALLERFVLAEGRAYTRLHAWEGDRMTPKHCYQNAMETTLFGIAPQGPPELAGDALSYVEGYACPKEGTGGLMLPFQHAWVGLPDGTFTDPTLARPQDYDYLGVEFTAGEAWVECQRNGVYGLLDTGRGINLQLIRDRAPALGEWFDTFLQDREGVRAAP